MFHGGYGSGFDPRNPDHLYQMARAGRRPVIQRFDEYYRCYPMAMAPGPDRPELNYGSKIFLPPSALDKVSKLHVQWPLLLEIVNGEKGKHSHAGVLEFVAEEGRAYLPHWMMETLLLDVGDMIQVKTTSLELAKLVKLQPQSVSFLEISDPKAVLEKAFRNFAALTKGDVFNFEYNDEIFYVAVLDVKPETDKMGVSMIETDVSVDFAPPVGYVEPEKQARGSGTSTPRSGKAGVPAGGTLHHQGTMAQAIGYQNIAPSTMSAGPTNFAGEGQRLVAKKATKATSSKPSTPDSAPSSGLTTPQTRRNPNGPMPLRLPPNKLFFGYEITPLKGAEEKAEEQKAASKPWFAGQGQSLRGASAKQKGPSDDEKGKRPGDQGRMSR
ncbi:hypothetical protein VUR80DRAFT_7462 [Thermomyces stellatus]